MASLLGTRYLIDWLRPTASASRSTRTFPTGTSPRPARRRWAGVAIVVSAVIGYAAAHVHDGRGVHPRRGARDARHRRGRGGRGVRRLDQGQPRAQPRAVEAGQDGRAAGRWRWASPSPAWRGPTSRPPSASPAGTSPAGELTEPGWVLFAVLLIAATTNAVNLTDGLDGLAAGSSIYAFIFMTVVAFWAFRHEAVYEINHALDLAVIAAAMVGGITGFLWWNARPGADLHGRHRLAGDRRRPRHAGAHPQRAAAAADRRRRCSCSRRCR